MEAGYMGIYLNPGKQRFEMAVNSEIFVDKTGMIRYLNMVINTNQRFVSVSRPRRFGKTMAADMLCAYYGHTADSRALFSQMKIAESEPAKVGRRTLAWDDYLGKFDVIRIVMTRFLSDEDTVKDSLNKLQKAVIRDIRLSYPDIDLFGENNIGENNVGENNVAENNILQVMEDVYTVTNRQFVVIIDEWDAVFRERREDKDGQKCYLDFLRNWLKDNECVALAYITGILPIKKYGKHSALNMFDEYSMVQPMQMAMYTGFTEEEVKTLCHEYEMEYSEISDWYDGYALHDQIPVNKRRLFRQGQYTDHKISVYSPLSVVKAMRNGLVDNYWNKTETYEALAEYIKMNYDGLKIAVSLLMDGGRVPVDLSTYQNDMSTFHRKDDILALLIHLGYLGFEGKEADGVVDFVHGSVFIPNKEILEEFKASTKAEGIISAGSRRREEIYCR